MRLRSFLVTLGAAGVAGSAGAYFLRYSIPPFAIAFFYLFFCLIALSRRVATGKSVVYNFAFIFLALGMFELYQQLTDPYRTFYVGTFYEVYEGGVKTNFRVEDPDLGYSILPKDRTVQVVKKSRDGSVIFDVTYSVNQYGLRKTPVLESDKEVFFFGCSFTFGEGVGDGYSLPEAFSRLSGVHTVNFSFNGYGPHQMLRMLEKDRPRTIEGKNPNVAVYIALAQHIKRAAGRAPWDRTGPRYEIGSGGAEYVGPFQEPTSLSSQFERVVFWFRLYNVLRQRYNDSGGALKAPATELDRQRFLAILLRARNLIVQKYQAEFVVVLWDALPWGNDEDRRDADWIARHLQDNRVPVLRVSTSLSNLDADEYYIPGDGHPNGAAYGLVANALNSFLLPYLRHSSDGAQRNQELVK